MNKDDLERRAGEAAAILGSSLVQEFMLRMERDIVAALKIADPRDKEGIAELHRLLRSNEKFRQLFEMAIRDGKFEQYKPPNAVNRWLNRVLP